MAILSQEAVSRLIRRMKLEGIVLPPGEIRKGIFADGRIHRFSTNGRRSDDAGWYIFHVGADGIIHGAFGDWRTGMSCRVADLREQGNRPPATAFRDLSQRKREEDARRRAERQFLREICQDMLSGSRLEPVAPGGHPYLERKGLPGRYGLFRVSGDIRLDNPYSPSGKPYILRDGDLFVPLADLDGTPGSFQWITGSGRKRCASGWKGLFFRCGRWPGPGGRILICEGVATACSLFESTGHCSVAAISHSGMAEIATKIRLAHPGAQIVICADNDTGLKDNVGMRKAEEAARVCGGLLAAAPEGMDFNDVFVQQGQDRVEAILARAREPAAETRSADPANGSRGTSGEKRETPAGSSGWIWAGHVPFGTTTLFVGRRGGGKRRLATVLAAASSGVIPWPDGSRTRRGGKVVCFVPDDEAGAMRALLARLHVNRESCDVRSCGSDLRASVEQVCGSMILDGAHVVLVSTLNRYMEDGFPPRDVIARHEDICRKYHATLLALVDLSGKPWERDLLRLLSSPVFRNAGRAAYLTRPAGSGYEAVPFPASGSLSRRCRGFHYALDGDLLSGYRPMPANRALSPEEILRCLHGDPEPDNGVRDWPKMEVC